MGSLMIIYKKHSYYIYDCGDSYIIHNSKYSFKDHHTHINRFSTAKYLIDLSIHKQIPAHLCDYFIESLIRLSDNEEYTQNLKIIQNMNRKERPGTSIKNKKVNYFNRTPSQRKVKRKKK